MGHPSLGAGFLRRCGNKVNAVAGLGGLLGSLSGGKREEEEAGAGDRDTCSIHTWAPEKHQVTAFLDILSISFS